MGAGLVGVVSPGVQVRGQLELHAHSLGAESGYGNTESREGSGEPQKLSVILPDGGGAEQPLVLRCFPPPVLGLSGHLPIHLWLPLIWFSSVHTRGRKRSAGPRELEGKVKRHKNRDPQEKRPLLAWGHGRGLKYPRRSPRA